VPVDQALATEFVNNAHGNLARVKELLAEHPELLMVTANMGETAILAAAHVGTRAVAEFLLEQGAPLDVCTAAMLGRREDVASFLEDPEQARAKGAHGIPLMFHVALGGDVEIAELVVAHGGGEGVDSALHGAVAYGHRPMVEWLLAHGAQDVNALNWQKKTPLKVAVEKGDEAIASLLRERGGHE
jgi:ankyrin repeat protein